jgi:biotin operon repressor
MPVHKKSPIAARLPSRVAGQRGDPQATPPVPWTFLSNHAHVLVVLYACPDLVLREVALRVGITERAVQRIVQELEEEGYLTRERIGRQNHYQITSGNRLRHRVESHCTIDQLLELVSQPAANQKPRS